MKLFKLLFLIFINVPTFACGQYIIEAFTVNQKTGIVNINSLEEYTPPIYSKFARVKFNTNYLAFRSKKDSLIAIHKTTLAQISPILLPQSYPVFEIDETQYLHAIHNSKSTILDSLLEVQFTFPKKYRFISQLEVNSGLIYAEKNDNIDVYQIKNKTLSLVYSDISADRFSIEEYSDQNNKPTEIYVFYGKKQVYLFSKELQLIKSIDKRIIYKTDLEKLINPSSNENEVLTMNGPSVKKSPISSKEFKEVGVNNNEKIFTSEDSKIKISINKDYKLTCFDSKNFIVYKLVKPTYEGGESISYGAQNSYEFMIDENNLKALLPVKYQKEIGLKLSYK